jgi:hypothetical protein
MPVNRSETMPKKIDYVDYWNTPVSDKKDTEETIQEFHNLAWWNGKINSYMIRYLNGRSRKYPKGHYPVPAPIYNVDYTYCDYRYEELDENDDIVTVYDPFITIYQTVVYRDDGDTWCISVLEIGLSWSRVYRDFRRN